MGHIRVQFRWVKLGYQDFGLNLLRVLIFKGEVTAKPGWRDRKKQPGMLISKLKDTKFVKHGVALTGFTLVLRVKVISSNEIKKKLT